MPGANIGECCDVRGCARASKCRRRVINEEEVRHAVEDQRNCYDNAFMESCFGTIKTELELSEYTDDVEAHRELSEYMHYYNVERRHSSLGYVSPAALEAEQTRGK